MALSNLFCPVMSGRGEHNCRCFEESCQMWDAGIPDVYRPGCGLVPRDSRRE